MCNHTNATSEIERMLHTNHSLYQCGSACPRENRPRKPPSTAQARRCSAHPKCRPSSGSGWTHQTWSSLEILRRRFPDNERGLTLCWLQSLRVLLGVSCILSYSPSSLHFVSETVSLIFGVGTLVAYDEDLSRPHCLTHLVGDLLVVDVPEGHFNRLVSSNAARYFCAVDEREEGVGIGCPVGCLQQKNWMMDSFGTRRIEPRNHRWLGGLSEQWECV